MDVDGYFYFWPELRGGAWEAWIMKLIADKLDKINEKWDNEINETFRVAIP